MAASTHEALTADKFMELCSSREYKSIIQQALEPMKKEIKTLKLRVNKQENDIAELRRKLEENCKEIRNREDKTTTEKNRLEAGEKINNLKFTGVGDTDDPKGKIIEIIKEELKVDIKEEEIEIIPTRLKKTSTKNETEQTNSLSSTKATTPKATETNKMHIVKFHNIWKKRQIYRNRMQLTSRIFINEDLTKEKSQIFYQSRNLKKQKAIKTTWTQDGTVYIRTNTDEKIMINNVKELNDAIGKKQQVLQTMTPISSGSFINFTEEETRKAERRHKRSTKKLQKAMSRQYSENYESFESCSNTSIY